MELEHPDRAVRAQSGHALRRRQQVFKSTDRGQTWTVISPDLTENTDREGLSLMGVAAKDITIAKNDGVQSYGNLVQLSESPRQAGVSTPAPTTARST